MADPLSPATRATKRNLLLASVLAISANAFNVSIDKIPVGGLSITFDDRLFAFLLLIVLVYFLCTFILYYLIDIRNLEATAHQDASEKAFVDRVNRYAVQYTGVIHRDLQSLTSDFAVKLHVNFSHMLAVGQPIPESVNLVIPDPTHRGQDQPVPAELHKDLFAKLAERQHYWIKRFPRDRGADKRRAAFLVKTTRSMYFLRNYFFDGSLPIALGVFALAAILSHLNLAWIQNYLPSFKALSSTH
jgi:hypothetical protein